MNQKSDKLFLLYLTGLSCLIIGVCLIVFCIYIIPFAFFGWAYPVPLSVDDLITWLELKHGVTGYTEIAYLLLPPFIAGLIFLYLARSCTFYLESQEKRADDDTINLYAAWALKRQPILSKSFSEIHPVFTIIGFVVVTILVLLVFETLFLYRFTSHP